MIRKKEVYLGRMNGKPVGTATFDTKPPWYYTEPGYAGKFTGPDEPAIYLTALAVLPQDQKQGFAGRLLQFVEEKARASGANWLRLDCRSEVPDLVNFYEKRGFSKVGDKPVDEGEDGTYWLMEKALKNPGGNPDVKQ